VTCRVPYALIGDELCRPSNLRHRHGQELDEEENPTDRHGLVHGIHNLAICVPQMVVMTFMGFMWMFTDEGDDEGFVGIVWILRFGGMCALGALYFTMRLQEPDEQKVEEEGMLLGEVPSEELEEGYRADESDDEHEVSYLA
jgi:hypothetical protein